MTARFVYARLVGSAMISATIGLTGCAGKLPKLAVCDGKHRRDANPYGTVLPGAPPRAPADTWAPPSEPLKGDAAPTVPPPAKTSAAAAPSNYASC